MEKNTIIFVIIATIIISVGFYFQKDSFLAPEPINQNVQETSELQNSDKSTETSETVTSNNSSDYKSNIDFGSVDESFPEKTIKAETDLFEIEFSTKGATINSLKLKKHFDGEEPVNMILNQTGEGAFNVALGDSFSYINDNFEYLSSSDSNTYTFRKNFMINDEIISLIKEYKFIPGEYLFELRINFDNENSKLLPLNDNDIAYTLVYGPQIGPEFTTLDGRYEYRKFYTYIGDKKEEIKFKSSESYKETTDLIKWASLTGKYFTVIGVPGVKNIITAFSQNGSKESDNISNLVFKRPVINSSGSSDLYRFYAGPRDPKVLEKYNIPEENKLGLSDLHLNEIVDTGNFLGWLETILKFILEMFYKVIPNYGVSIIFLTFLIKIVLYPFTKKSYESTGQMQKIQPQIKELQEKYKDDSQKMNTKMAELYKKEGVNPMGGCLPMLFQFPVFIALFGLLNKYFELRGAVFIPGWISDLSAPESIFNFAPATIPLLGWSDIRLLPILYLGTQLISGKVTQSGSSAGQSGMQTKMLTLGMPIMFFFVLYNMPSGLILYWMVQNILTVFQQTWINRHNRKSEKTA